MAKMTFQPKKRQRKRFTASEQEWRQQTAVRFLQLEEPRAERDLRSDLKTAIAISL